MEIHGDQIAVQFKTYGVPPVVEDFFAANDIAIADLSTRTIPAHGTAAVKELMAYTTGLQVVLAIAALALGQIEERAAPEPTGGDADGDGHDDDSGEFAEGNREAADVHDANGLVVVEGARVVIITTDKDGGAVEAAGATGEVESIERRGAIDYVTLSTDPEEGHTTGDLITVRADTVEVLTA